MEKTLAVYRGTTRYIVREFDAGRPGLWALLGPTYDHALAQKLADALTQEAEDRKRERRMSRNRD